MQKQLKEKAKEEKEKGNNVKVSYGKIFMKDKWLRWNEREKNRRRQRRKKRMRKGKGWRGRGKKKIKNLFLEYSNKCEEM